MGPIPLSQTHQMDLEVDLPPQHLFCHIGRTRGRLGDLGSLPRKGPRQPQNPFSISHKQTPKNFQRSKTVLE